MSHRYAPRPFQVSLSQTHLSKDRPSRGRHRIRPLTLSQLFAALLAFAALLVAPGANALPEAAAETKAEKASAPALWRLSDKDSTVWLFGAFHLPPRTADWRSNDLSQALDRTDTIWLEAEPDNPKAQRAVAAIIARHGYVRNGAPLTERLGDDGQRLAAIADELGLDTDMLDRMRPWHAHLALTVQFVAGQAALQKAAAQENDTGNSTVGSNAKGGAPLSDGVEGSLRREARARGRPVAHLETIEQQIRLFADLPPAAELNLLRATLREWATQKAEFPALQEAWRTGDVASLDYMLNRRFRKEAPEAFTALVEARNAAWAERIETLLRNDENVFLAVSIGHLVGDGSLIEALANRGLIAERVAAATGENGANAEESAKERKRREKEARKKARKAEKKAKKEREKKAKEDDE